MFRAFSKKDQRSAAAPEGAAGDRHTPGERLEPSPALSVWQRFGTTMTPMWKKVGSAISPRLVQPTERPKGWTTGEVISTFDLTRKSKLHFTLCSSTTVLQLTCVGSVFLYCSLYCLHYDRCLLVRCLASDFHISSSTSEQLSPASEFVSLMHDFLLHAATVDAAGYLLVPPPPFHNPTPSRRAVLLKLKLRWDGRLYRESLVFVNVVKMVLVNRRILGKFNFFTF